MTVRVHSTPLRGSALTRVALDGHGAPGWFLPAPTGAAEWLRRADTMRGSLAVSDWASTLAPAMRADGAAGERLARAASAGFAVTTGQQPGLFGGPLYTWWKALSALSLANRLEEITGRPVVPIFWAATDDSDFVEASSTTVIMHDSASTIEMSPAVPPGSSLATMPLGDITAQIDQLASAAGSAPHAGIFDRVRAAYAADSTVGGAYVSLLSAVLNPLGIAVIDASHAATRAAAAPVLRKALQRASQIEAALASRAEALVAAGHAPQVKLVKGRSLVFSERDGVRKRIDIREAESAVRESTEVSLSSNVLLRPIVERSIIPTVAYVGGPAEVAYFAQVSAVAQALDTLEPLVLPRWSGIIIEPRVERILERRGLAVDDFRDPHAAETRIARSSLPDELIRRIEDLRETIERATSELSSTEGADIVSPRVLPGLRRNLARQVDRLTRRYSAAVKRTGNDALSDVSLARAALFPGGVPQERALNIVPLLARHGDALLDDVMRGIDPHWAALE